MVLFDLRYEESERVNCVGYLEKSISGRGTRPWMEGVWHGASRRLGWGRPSGRRWDGRVIRNQIRLWLFFTRCGNWPGQGDGMTWWAFQKHFWGGARAREERTRRLLHWSGGEMMEETHVVWAPPGGLPSLTTLLEIAGLPLPGHPHPCSPSPPISLLRCGSHFLIILHPLLVSVVIYWYSSLAKIQAPQGQGFSWFLFSNISLGQILTQHVLLGRYWPNGWMGRMVIEGWGEIGFVSVYQRQSWQNFLLDDLMRFWKLLW